MNILVLMGSPHPKGNTAFLADAFTEGAKSAGHNVTRLGVGSMKINGCIGCEYCHGKGAGQCIQKDDMQTVYQEMAKADMIVFASPIYYWSFSGQMSSLITRFYSQSNESLAVKKFAMLLSSGSHGVYEPTTSQYKSVIGYIGAKDCGIVTAYGDQDKTQAKADEAYNIGKNA